MTIAAILLLLAGSYAAIGLLFGVAFVLRGAAAIDPAAAHPGWGFRVMILPGAAVLWPILAAKWGAARRARGERP